jgi:hypothetical protein
MGPKSHPHVVAAYIINATYHSTLTAAAVVLQSLNPLPYVAMWANCVAWLVYAFLTHDPYVLASNVPGVLIASYMTISCYGFADDKVGVAKACRQRTKHVQFG